jgi:Flp pilus assembly protein TadG
LSGLKAPGSKHVHRALLDQSGQAIAEFVLVLFALILVLFAILELGLMLNAKLALASAAREIARICAVEGGYVGKAIQRADSVIESAGLEADRIDLAVVPKQAIYGTDINVSLSYDYRVKSPVVSVIAGPTVTLRAKAVTRSEFVPR